MVYRLNATDNSSLEQIGRGIWLRSHLPIELGRCVNDVCHLDNDLTLAYTHFQPQQDLLEYSNVERASRSLTITIALEGESSTLGIDGQRFDFCSGHSTMAAFSSVRAKRRFPAERIIRQLRLIVQEPLLQRYGLAHLLKDVRNDFSAKHISFGKYGHCTQRLAQSLIHLHTQDAGLLDLQIAALSLLSDQTQAFLPSQKVSSQLRGDDQDRILKAQDILLSQYAHQISIAYLCTTVGINEFKLKQGFRELFNTSPYRMLMDIRMSKAWELLETGLYVSTVAYKVGYQHLSSFSTAFEHYYGRTPKSIAKSSNNH